LPQGVLSFDSIEGALDYFERSPFYGEKGLIQSIFCIGGAQIYAEAFRSSRLRRIYLTRINQSYRECDVFLPPLPQGFREMSGEMADQEMNFALPRYRTENGVDYEFKIFSK
jgi:dihydrofolate reductase